MDTKKKNTITKLFLRLVGVMLAFGLVFGALNVTGVKVRAAEKGTKTEKKSSKPTKKEVRALAKKISKANKLDRLIKKHKSICRLDKKSILWISKNAVYIRSYPSSSANYISDNGNYIFDWAEDSFEYLYNFDKTGNNYSYNNVNYYFDFVFSKESLLEEKAVSIEYTDTSVILTRLINEEDKEVLKTAWGITDLEGSIYEAIEVDKNTYEVQSLYVYPKGQKDNVLAIVSHIYDLEEPAECIILREMGERQEKVMVSCTVVLDAGTENEVREEKIIPVGSSIAIYAPNLDGVIYSDPECTKPSGKWDGLDDVVLYVKTSEG